MNIIKPHSRPVRLMYFWIGIIATFAYRVIIVLNYYDPYWVKVVWYIGTVGFTVYFWHRYDIEKKRSKLVAEYELEELTEKISAPEKQKEALEYIIKTTRTSKSQWNSLFICLFSLFAFLVGLVLDLI